MLLPMAHIWRTSSAHFSLGRIFIFTSIIKLRINGFIPNRTKDVCSLKWAYSFSLMRMSTYFSLFLPTYIKQKLRNKHIAYLLAFSYIFPILYLLLISIVLISSIISSTTWNIKYPHRKIVKHDKIKYLQNFICVKILI